jgi:mevalonate kinase
MAIKPRVFVTVRRSKNPHRAKSPYIDGCFEETGVKGSVYISSQLPSASGLGSSAAVTVATLAAINDEFGLGFSREQIAEKAFSIEKKVQKGKASQTDTAVSTFGGMVLITGLSRRRLPPHHFSLVIGNTLIAHNTARLVESVAEFRKKNPDICNPVIDAIGAITMESMYHLSRPSEIGRLMNMNHALLEVLGVGHPSLSRLVLAARAAGAYGAKMTGAGGGGCMIALCHKHLKTRIAGAIEATGSKALITTIDTEGVRKEHEN